MNSATAMVVLPPSDRPENIYLFIKLEVDKFLYLIFIKLEVDSIQVL